MTTKFKAVDKASIHKELNILRGIVIDRFSPTYTYTEAVMHADGYMNSFMYGLIVDPQTPSEILSKIQARIEYNTSLVIG